MSKSRTVTLSHYVDSPVSVQVEQAVTFDHESRRADAIKTTHVRVEGTTYTVESAAALHAALTEALAIVAADFGEV